MPAGSYDRHDSPGNPSADLETDLQDVHGRAKSMGLRPGQQLLMLALNGVPLLHLVGIVLVLCLPFVSIGWRVLSAASLLYLMPPLAGRLLLRFCRADEGRVAIGSRSFFAWWALLNLQIVFCRLPFLEEVLRLIPGIYSAWLRLCGARIGRLTYWAPGTTVLDRPFLEIGDDVVMGAGVRINAHVMARDSDGNVELLLARISIGDRAFIGGYSLLTAGTRIASGEATRACLISPPFSEWKDGRRIKPSVGEEPSDGTESS